MARKKTKLDPDLMSIDQSTDQTQDHFLYQQIFDAVLAQRLLPGVKLTEDELADIFGVSRTVVRRSLLRLSHDRIVDIRPNKGASVASPSVQQAKEVLGVRSLIESAIVREAVEKITAKQIANLRAIVSAEKSSVEGNEKGASLRLSGDFHMELARCSANTTLIKFINELIPLTSLIIAQYEKPGHSLCSYQEHYDLIDVIEAGDADAAVSMMDDHLEHIENKLDLSDEDSAADLRSVFAHVAERGS